MTDRTGLHASRADRRRLAVVGVALLALFGWAGTLVPDVIPLYTLVPATPGVLIGGIGVFLLLRTDARRIGWLMVLQTFFVVHIAATDLFEASGATWAGVVGPLGWNALACLTVAIIVYPTGRPASRVLGALVGLTVGGMMLASVHWLGTNIGWWEAAADPLALASAASWLPLALSFPEQARIYRRRSALERTQLKWYLPGLVGQALYAVPVLLDWPEAAFAVASGVLTMSFPVAMLIGITRYGLYEIDRIISRTVAYAIVVAVLAALGIGAVTAITSLLPTQDALATALATLGVLAAFDPLRRRVTVAVDRRFDRTRYVARQVVEDFGRQVQDVTDLDEVVDRVHAVAGTTLAPTTVAVWQPTGARP